MMRRLSIVPIMLAMLMVMMTTVIPHHHHQAMICLVKEVCCMDGCCDDEHTGHSDPNQQEEESHCVAHENYSPSENLKLDGAAFSGIVIPVAPILAEIENEHILLTGTSRHEGFGLVPFLPSPPPLSAAASNAPPRNA